MYKNFFGILLIIGALVFGFLILKRGNPPKDCAYTLFRFSPKSLVPLMKEKMNFGSTQITLLEELDAILAEGAIHISKSRHEMMNISAKEIVSGKFNAQLLYDKTLEDDRFLQERTLKALKKMEEFITSLSQKQRLLVSDKLNNYRKECTI